MNAEKAVVQVMIKNQARDTAKDSSNCRSFQIENFDDLSEVCFVDEQIATQLGQRKDAGDLRLNFLASRFEKDVAGLVQNVIHLAKKASMKSSLTKFDWVSKSQFRQIWEHLKVCSKESSTATVMSAYESQTRGKLDRQSKELIFVNDLWDLVNLRFDPLLGKQSTKVEFQIVLSFLDR